jgi:murein DD-endopeptidase MepM/ murein hydrolase activator NlpD
MPTRRSGRRARFPFRWAGLLAAAIAASTCAHAPPAPLHPAAPEGSFYVVREGDTLDGLARTQGVPLEDLAEINGLAMDAPLAGGQVIFVLAPEPGVPSQLPPPGPLLQKVPASTAIVREGPPPATLDEELRWPLAQGRVSSAFGRRWGRQHEGIDLEAPSGTPVLAAREGRVLYAGNTVRGYGNMVVLQHANDLLTAYAHNSELLVRVGDRVKAGQPIARVGQSGRATAPHLHFEVRRGHVPMNPLRFLESAAAP